MTIGIIIGKFNVIHKGHLYLVDKALEKIGDGKLFVFLCSCKNDFISGENRIKEFRKIYPKVEFIHVKDEIKEASNICIGAPKIWSECVLNILKKFGIYKVDFVFGSEDYTKILANNLLAKSFLIDLERKSYPISSSEILENPVNNCQFIPKFMKKYFLKIIFIDFELDNFSLKCNKINYHGINTYKDFEKIIEKIDDLDKVLLINLNRKETFIKEIKMNYKFIHNKELLFKELEIFQGQL